MQLSANLRRLRQQCGMTQSALAEALGVSDRAVSRWETGAALPDVTLLPHLSLLLHASVDALLGVDDAQRQSVIDNALESCSRHMQSGQRAEAEAALRQTLKAWPGEPELMVALARTLLAAHTPEGAREALALGRAADGKPARLSTAFGCKQVMALALSALGRPEEAARLVSDELPSFWASRELLYTRVAPADKAEHQRRFNLLWLADHAFFTLREMAKAASDDALAAELLERGVCLLRTVTGENAGMYEGRIAQGYMLQAERYLHLGQGEQAAHALQQARAAAAAYRRHDGHYAAPWLQGMTDVPTPPAEADALENRLHDMEST